MGVLLCCLAFVGFCGFVNLANAPSKRERDRQARTDAIRLIEALGSYHAEQGSYPLALDELAPRYLPLVPQTPMGFDFEYALVTGEDTFRLGYFDAPMGVLPSDGFYAYETGSEEWNFTVR